MREGRPPRDERPSSVLGSVEYPSRISVYGKLPHARPSVKLAGAFSPSRTPGAGYGTQHTIGLSCGLARWWRSPMAYVLWRPVARPNGPQIASKMPVFRKCGENKQSLSTTRFLRTKPRVEALTYPGVVDKSGVCRILPDSTFLEAGMNLESVPSALSIFQYKYRSNNSMLDYR